MPAFLQVAQHEVKNQHALALAKRTFQIVKMDKTSKWEVVLGAPDKVNITCLMHDTRLRQLDVKMTTSTEPKR